MFALSLFLSLAQSVPTLGRAERTAIFRAAGAYYYPRRGWALQFDTDHFERARIVRYSDLNGDGRPEAVVEQDSDMWYGNHGPGNFLLTKQASGKWRKVIFGPEVFGDEPTGGLEFMKTRGFGGWPDIMVERVVGYGCDLIFRFDGKTYALNRMRFEEDAVGRVFILDPRKYDIGCYPKKQRMPRTHKAG